jgi:hypothetical protein
MCALSLSFPDQTYSSSNKPSTTTLKADLTAIEADVNAHTADSTIHYLANTLWPVGSVFTAVVATNPATLLGFGTWSQIASGKMLVGQNGSDADFDTAEETGGSKTKNLAHNHSHNHTGPSHDHGGATGTPSASAPVGIDNPVFSVSTTNHTHTIASGGTGNTSTDATSGGSATQDVMNPYFVVYFWKRTA